ATPNENSVSLLNLLRLYDLTLDHSYKDKASSLIALFSSKVTQSPLSMSSALIALDYYMSNTKEVAVVGHLDSEESRLFREFLFSNFLPHTAYGFGEPKVYDDLTGVGL